MGFVTLSISAAILSVLLIKIVKYLIKFIRFTIKVKRLPKSECNYLFGHVLDALVPPNSK